jgi:uncharacterized protein (UPF0218 family)
LHAVYVLTPELREKFKEPFGLLIKGSSTKTMQQIKFIIETEKPSKVVSVGDRVSRNLHAQGITAQLAITDNKTLRKTIRSTELNDRKLYKAKNPPGTITDEAIDAVNRALQSEKNAQVIIDGEEDLLTLMVIAYAPKDTLVVYGQPYEGVVAVKVTEEKRASARGLLKEMTCSKAK